MSKKEEFIIKKTEVLEMSFYAVRSQDGKWLRAKKHHNAYRGEFDSNGSWTDNIAEAKIYGKPGPAKSQVTFWGTNYPEYGVPDLVRIVSGKCEFLDQEDRVKKAELQKKIKQAKNDVARWESYSAAHAEKVIALHGSGNDDETIRFRKGLLTAIKELESLIKQK